MQPSDFRSLASSAFDVVRGCCHVAPGCGSVLPEEQRRDSQAFLRCVTGIVLVALLAGCGPVAGSRSSHITNEVTPSAAASLSAVPQTDQAARDPAEGVTSAAAGRGDAAPSSPAPAPSQQTPPDPKTQPFDPNTIREITFDDLKLDMQLGTLFDRSMLTPRAAELDGQRVRLRGFIFAGSVFQQSGIRSFLFVMNTQCKFGPQGLAYCVMPVELDEGVTTQFTTYPITVEGRLTVRPHNDDGFTWSVYHIQGQRVF